MTLDDIRGQTTRKPCQRHLDAAVVARRVSGRAIKVLAGVLNRRDDPRLLDAVCEAIPLLDEAMEGALYMDVPDETLALSRERPGFVAALAAMLLSQAGVRLSSHPMPDALTGEFERQAIRVLEACADPASDEWSLADDVIQKDIALCRLDAFACRAQMVEKHSGLSIRKMLNQNFATFSQACSLLTAQGFRRQPYFEIHTHTPMLDGFNEDGWMLCYMLIAELLELYPDRLGMIGSAWFYDPQLLELSPRLAYLQIVPLSGGAMILKGATSAKDIDLATATSPTRRAAYEAGRYLPVNHTLIWPRQALLRWAKAQGPLGSAT